MLLHGILTVTELDFSVQDLAYQKDAFAQPPHLGNHDGHVQDHFACPPTIIDL